MTEKAVSSSTTTLLFDHDGTLVNSEGVHFALWQDVMRAYNVELSQAFYCNEMVGIPVTQNAIDLVQHFSLPVSPDALTVAKRKKVKDYLAKQPFPLMPYAAETLKACYQKGFTLAIVTAGSSQSVQKTLSGYDLEDYVSCVVAVEDVSRSKPDPECYLLAMQKLNVMPEHCVAIEDTRNGLSAAVSANVPCVVLPTQHSQKHNLASACAQYSNLQQWIEQEITPLS